MATVACERSWFYAILQIRAEKTGCSYRTSQAMVTVSRGRARGILKIFV